MTRIAICTGDDDLTLADFRTVLAEYFEHLTLTWSDPDPPRWQRELDGLPGAFARPEGRMLVAYVGDEPAGIVAIVGREDADCEVKRLYVRPQHRRLGVSRALMQRAMSEAAEAGYCVMRLGTSRDFGEALALYDSLGFERSERFREGFTDRAVFMSRPLDRDE